MSSKIWGFVSFLYDVKTDRQTHLNFVQDPAAVMAYYHLNTDEINAVNDIINNYDDDPDNPDIYAGINEILKEYFVTEFNTIPAGSW
ncbi:MAG: hypothetical protein QG641_958 [Candidatus Poribacteria bacterium]|nr:hypothetical protein [Candidatus Poribacteria bacterium]MDQ1327675.1 hypothetical protein [Candidatus Poribacteria bacterium]